jgi:2,3,4,5-tetrahydropyridine-2-carboxylate N-succinyltransferase
VTALDVPAFGFGIATLATTGQVLDVWFPTGRFGLGALPDVTPYGRPTAGLPAGEPLALGELGDATAEHGGALPSNRSVGVIVRVDSLATAPADAYDVWLRLHLLSSRQIQPHQSSLDGIFGLLTNVAWTSLGPVLPDDADELRVRERAAGRRVMVYGIDKFPRMIDYVTPTGVRVADADRVRLGAHLAPGTTVMHEGFVNYNAGTLGSSMVEGRVSAGVVVGDGSDVGGGASIMGTLSGGGKEVVRIGERCLIGANAGVGISLGDDCVVEAGCYITSGSKLALPDGGVVKARELSGQPGLLFWRNSLSGSLEVKPRTGGRVELNAALHANA